jgi:DNA-binding PadR family transcriptional regulator
MFQCLILGLLRDGEARHGYDLIREYRARSGGEVSAGNFYRELARLTAQCLIESGVNPPDADPRRVPYLITETGCEAFDRWLIAPIDRREEMITRLLFADRIPVDKLAGLFDRWQEELLLRGKALAREREDALGKGDASDSPGRYDALPCLLLRRMKHVTAELDFLAEFRQDFDTWQRRWRSATREGDTYIVGPKRPKGWRG